MRHLLALLAFAALPVQAETLSQEIGRAGIAATEARLAALPAPGDDARFALGGLRFLGAVEASLQARWRMGLPERLRMVPFLRLPIDENPNPAPFDPGAIAALFRDAETRLEAAREPLAAIPDGSDFGLEIALADLWFDLDADGQRDPGEDLLEIAGPMILGRDWLDRDPAAPAPVIRFDAADAAWLTAYTHLLQGLSRVILAYDPTEALARMTAAKAALHALAPPGERAPDADGFGDYVDTLFVVIDALDQPPDAPLLAAAQQNFLSMITENRRFWDLVARETDNDREWLPNDAQQSALGVELPKGTGTQWLAVLADLEAILKGDLLIPYWRGAGGGIDVGAMFADPRPIGLAGWIQGAEALPYLKSGPVAQGESWRTFNIMMRGEAMLFSLFLN